MTVQFRYLSQEEVIKVGGMDMSLTMDAVEEVFALLGRGECILPSKVVLRWGEKGSELTTRGHMNAMPGYVGGPIDMAGQKWGGGFYRNPIDHRLPSITCLVILNDPYKGIPVAVMDGTLISAMRTGAQAGVAVKYLGRQDARTVGVIGAGAQSRALLMSFKIARPGLSRTLVYDINEDRSRQYCEEMKTRLEMSFEVLPSAEGVITQADILTSATTTIAPFVKPGWVRPGCLYCQMGGFEAEPAAILEFDKIVVDNWDEIQHRGLQALPMAKVQGKITDANITAHLGEIILGRKPGRQSPAERIYFSAVGMGLLDIGVATRLLHKAEEQNVGTMLNLWENAAAFI
ncbi:MAG: ornithine cyclodeaminase family protein [Thermodesulfobacteriota bacterium]